MEDCLERGFAIVVDVGKTLSKITLWSREGTLLDRRVRANAACTTDGLRRLDVDGIAEWLVAALAEFAEHPVEYLIPVGHGAGVAVLIDGRLAFPPVDYEQPLPDEIALVYLAERDPFALTGSPALPDGLNLGAQLFWLDRLHPELMQRATFIPWAQYWAWFLSGVAVSEITSLGCHTDLWLPDTARFSPLAERMGWADRFAPLVLAADPIGILRPDLSLRTGLPVTTRVLAGLHDSNAALLAARGFSAVAANESTVLSTGTWFVSMRSPALPLPTASLPMARDCLVNVDVFGRAVPSARFMGGREIENLIEIDTRRIDIRPDQPALVAAVTELLAGDIMLLPTFAPGCGPFPQGAGAWHNPPTAWIQRRAAASLYAALVTDASLDLIGSCDRLLVEGRFADAEVFVRALAALRPTTTVYTANAHNDVSFGALRLIDPGLQPQGELVRIEPLEADLAAYRARWRERIGSARR